MPREKSERQKTFPSRNFQALSRYSLLAYFLVLCQSGQNANGKHTRSHSFGILIHTVTNFIAVSAECIYDTGRKCFKLE